VEYFKYVETTVTNQNLIHDKLREDYLQGMLATIQFRIVSSFPYLSVCLSVCLSLSLMFICRIGSYLLLHAAKLMPLQMQCTEYDEILSFPLYFVNYTPHRQNQLQEPDINISNIYSFCRVTVWNEPFF